MKRFSLNTILQRLFSPAKPSKPAKQVAHSMLLDFYEKRSELDGHLSEVSSKEQFIEKTQDERFRKQVMEPIHNEVGIIGSTYAIVNQTEHNIWFLRNRKLNNHEHKNFPFLEISANGFFGLPEKEENRLNAELIDLMYESENKALTLRNDKPYKAPFFLQNLPPYQSIHAFPPLPFEEKLRKDKKINYTYCYTGEVVFHVYAWRWLMKHAQYAGFDHVINLDASTIINKPEKNTDIWALESWENFKDLPEKKWLQYLASLAKGKDPRDDEKRHLIDHWKTVTRRLDNKMSNFNYDFYQHEWGNLCVGEDCPLKKDVRLALFSYTRHILSTTKKRDQVDELYSFGKKDYKTVVGADKEAKEEIRAVNKAIDKIIKEEGNKRSLILKLFKKAKRRKRLYHYIIRKTIYEALIQDILKPKEEITIRDLLRAINRRSRFPIMATFFQIVLGKKNIPVEHYFFPIGKSYRYTFPTKLPRSQKHEKEEQNSNVAVACVSLAPIWALSKDSAHKCFMTKDGKYLTDKAISEISEEAFTRLRIVQDYLKMLSEPLVDTVFYGQIVEDDLEDKTKQKQFFYQAHEIRKLIESIRPTTPSFLLEEVRLYFNVIFGSREFLIKSYYDGLDYLPKDYKIGDSFKEMVDNATKIASRVQAVVQLIEEKKLASCTPDQFQSIVENYQSEVDNRISYKHKLPKVLSENRRDEKATPFHFLSAVICGLRNALKHKKSASEIIVHLSEDWSELWMDNETQTVSPLFRGGPKQQKLHPGSTTASLNYYVGVYSAIEAKLEPMPDLNMHRTSVPIPKH